MKSKNTEVALANPNVSSSINMSLNQNDMIDLVIEHQLEILSSKLEVLKTDLDANNEAIQNAYDSDKQQIILRASVKNEDLVIFNKIVKTHKLNVEDTSGINVDSYAEKCVKIGSYDSISIDAVENYKDPYAYAKRHSSFSELKFSPITNVYIRYRASIGTLKVDYSDSITPTTEEQEEHKKVMIPLLKEKLALKKEYAIIAMSYLEYKYGEKRIKSKIVKASLSKSDEGRGILKMLEGATNIKLLG